MPGRGGVPKTKDKKVAFSQGHVDRAGNLDRGSLKGSDGGGHRL